MMLLLNVGFSDENQILTEDVITFVEVMEQKTYEAIS